MRSFRAVKLRAHLSPYCNTGRPCDRHALGGASLGLITPLSTATARGACVGSPEILEKFETPPLRSPILMNQRPSPLCHRRGGGRTVVFANRPRYLLMKQHRLGCFGDKRGWIAKYIGQSRTVEWKSICMGTTSPLDLWISHHRYEVLPSVSCSTQTMGVSHWCPWAWGSGCHSFLCCRVIGVMNDWDSLDPKEHDASFITFLMMKGRLVSRHDKFAPPR